MHFAKGEREGEGGGGEKSLTELKNVHSRD